MENKKVCRADTPLPASLNLEETKQFILPSPSQASSGPTGTGWHGVTQGGTYQTDDSASLPLAQRMPLAPLSASHCRGLMNWHLRTGLVVAPNSSGEARSAFIKRS